MKKVNLLLFSVFVVLAGLVSSCTKDTTYDTCISFAGDTGYTAADATVTSGSTFKVKWTVTSSTNMAYFSILKDGSAYDVWSQKEIPSASKSTYIAEVTITAPLTAGTYTYDFVVYDKDKVELGRKSIVITVTAAVQLNSYTAKLLGAQNNAAGSFFVSETGDVLLTSQLTTANRPKVDITYGINNSSSTVMSASVRESLGFPAFSNATETKYKASSLDISAVTNADLVAIDFTSGAATSIVVAQSSTYAFKNAAGKVGIFKVTVLVAGTSGSITIDVKVQP